MDVDKDLDIRYSKLEDVVYLKSWLKNDFFYYPISNNKEIDSFAKNWVGFHKFYASLTATYKNKPIGIATLFLMPYIKIAHQCWFYMAVAKNFRRQQVGDALLKNLLHLIRTKFRLEILGCETYSEDCPLIPLLKKYQFQPVFTQQNYVKQQNHYHCRTVWERRIDRH